MAIKKRPNQSQSDIKTISPEDFIEAKTPASEASKDKIQIAIRFPEILLSQIDRIAERRGMSRNGLINYLCSKGIEDDTK